MGFSMANKIKGSDLSPYLQLENIDPQWLEAVGYRKSPEETASQGPNL